MGSNLGSLIWVQVIPYVPHPIHELLPNHLVLLGCCWLAGVAVRAAERDPDQAFSVRLVHQEASPGTVEMVQTVRNLLDGQMLTVTHHVATNSILNATHVVRASPGQLPGVREPVVEVRLSAEGRRLLAKATREAIGGKLAVIVVGKLVEVPRVVGEVRSGAVQLSFKDKQEMEHALEQIRSGRRE